MVSPGMLCPRAASTAVRSRGLALMSPPPRRAATVISLMSLVKSLPRLASLAAFLCLMVLHFEWPDIGGRLRAGSTIAVFREQQRALGSGVRNRDNRCGAVVAVDGGDGRDGRGARLRAVPP